MNIGSGSGYPSSALSNFAGHRFVFDGVEVAGMEGLLQAFKFDNIDMQKHVCTLIGKAAKFKGKKKNWKRHQTLYWQGKEFKRDSKEYQDLLDRAYYEMAKQSDSFRRALLASGDAKLTHSLGHNKISETVLTEQEFCSRLMLIRGMLKRGEIELA